MKDTKISALLHPSEKDIKNGTIYRKSNASRS